MEAEDIPIACDFKTVGNIPTLFVGFASKEAFGASLDTFAEHLGGPYCNEMNATDIQAALMVTVNNPPLGRMFACRGQQWSDWFPLQD
jgi:hypothetical protein